MHTLSYQGAASGGKRLNDNSRLDGSLPPTKLMLRLTEQLHVQQMVFVEATRSPVKHSVLCKYNTYFEITNCSTEVGEHPILFFLLFFVEEEQ